MTAPAPRNAVAGRRATDHTTGGRLRLLIQASDILASSLDYEETLRSVARLVVPFLADWSAIQLVSDGALRTVEVAHVDPKKAALARELEERYPARPDAPRGVYQVIRTGKSELYVEITEQLLQSGARDAEHLRITRALGLRSAIIVPLQARGRVLGALTLVSAESGRRYDREDMLFAETLASRAAVAVDNARLYAEARDSETRYRLLFESNPHPLWVYDVETLEILAVNEAAARQYGYAEAELLRMKVPELHSPDEVPSLLMHLERLRGPRETPRVWRHRRKDGAVLTVEISSQAVRFLDRRARLALGEDVTERQRRQEALRLLAEMGEVLASLPDYDATLRMVARLAVPRLADGCSVLLLRHGVLDRVEVAHVDPAKVPLVRELETQFSPGPGSPTGVYAVAQSGAAEMFPEVTDQLLERRVGSPAQLELLRRLGLRSAMLVPLRARGRVFGAIRFVMAESGRRYGYGDLATAEAVADRAGVVLDNARLFVEAQQAEAGSRQYAERLQSLLAMAQGILAVRAPKQIAETAIAHMAKVVPDCRLAYVGALDPAAAELELLAKRESRDRETPREGTPAPAGLGIDHELLRSGVVQSVTDYQADPGSTPPLLAELGVRSYVVVPLIVEGALIGALGLASAQPAAFGPGLLEIANETASLIALAFQGSRLRQDLERNASDLERRVARRTAELDERNAELDAFAYSVSHDLRAPLRSIDGFTHALLEDYGDRLDAGGRDDMQRVRAATRRMGQLIDDMLRLSRVTRAEMHRERIDLSAMAQSVADDLVQTDPARTVTFVIAPDLSTHADPQLLQLVVENLMGNAWKYTVKQPAARIEVGATEREGRQAFYVRDDGAGFDMAYVNKLFQPFQRLHSEAEFPGTGVGLATVQRIIRRHGGRVWAESTVGDGATFYFTL